MAAIDNSIEIWKTIPFASEYEASTFGRVRRSIGRERARAGRIIQPAPAGPRRTYLYLTLVENDGHPRSQGVHRIVLRTFEGEPPTPRHEAAHKDGNSFNNTAENLIWKLPVENAADRARHGTQTRGTRYGLHKLTDEDVRNIRAATGTQKQIGLTYGVSQSMVWKIRSGKAWAHVK